MGDAGFGREKGEEETFVGVTVEILCGCQRGRCAMQDLGEKEEGGNFGEG